MNNGHGTHENAIMSKSFSEYAISSVFNKAYSNCLEKKYNCLGARQSLTVCSYCFLKHPYSCDYGACT